MSPEKTAENKHNSLDQRSHTERTRLPAGQPQEPFDDPYAYLAGERPKSLLTRVMEACNVGNKTKTR